MPRLHRKQCEARPETGRQRAVLTLVKALFPVDSAERKKSLAKSSGTIRAQMILLVSDPWKEKAARNSLTQTWRAASCLERELATCFRAAIQQSRQNVQQYA